MATLSRLERLVALYFPRARIWLTEYGYQSNPPDRILGVTPALQARYVSEGAYAAYRAPRVDMLIHFLYRDEPTLARFQSGLVTLEEHAAAGARRVRAAARRDRTFGLDDEPLGRAACPERRLEWRSSSAGPAARGKSFARISVSARGYFRWRGTLPRGAVVRVHASGLVGAPLTIT